MRVLICGDRDWVDRDLIHSWIEQLQEWGVDSIIEGEARGADTIAREEAEKLGIEVEKFPAEWNRFGRAAGPIRNRQMLDENPDLVLAFHDHIEFSKGTRNTLTEFNMEFSKGTRNTLTEARDKRKITCILISHEEVVVWNVEEDND